MVELGLALWRGVVGGGERKGRADRGINTPALHRMSRAPKGWLPSIYCNGFPFERWRARA